jgi:hypothetical protein
LNLLYQQLYEKGTLNFSIHQEGGGLKKWLVPSPTYLHCMITIEVNELLVVIRTKKGKVIRVKWVVCGDLLNYQELRMSEVPLSFTISYPSTGIAYKLLQTGGR